MVYCYQEASFEAVVREIFTFAGYKVSDDEVSGDYRFDFIAEDDGRTFAVDVKSQPQHYSDFVPFLKELVNRTVTHAKDKQSLPVIVFAGVVDGSVKSKIDEIDSSITVLDIRN